MAGLIGVVVACLGLAGALTGVWSLATWGGVVTMKPATAFCLLVISSVFLVKKREPRHFALLSFTGFYALATVAGFFEASTWIIAEPDDVADYSTNPGVPSIPTVALIVAWCVAIEFRIVRRGVAWASVGTATVCLAGHLVGSETMIFFVEGWSSAMAIPTAAIFLCVGTGELRTP